MTGNDKIDVGDVTLTAYITLYMRAWESRSKDSILEDHAAAAAVDRLDVDFDKLMVRGGAGNRFTIALRAKKLDDWAADFLRRHPDATVLHLGCGLDSRPFRLDLPPDVRWFDIDLPNVIEQHQLLYPAPKGYRRIGASVTDPGWLEEIPTDRPVLIIAEGLMMYLTEGDIERMLHRFTDRFDTGELIFDGMPPWVVRSTQRLSKLLARKGYPAYSSAIRDGKEIERWNPRFRHVETVNILSQGARIPVRGYRVLYRLMNAIPRARDLMRVFRYAF